MAKNIVIKHSVDQLNMQIKFKPWYDFTQNKFKKRMIEISVDNVENRTQSFQLVD